LYEFKVKRIVKLAGEHLFFLGLHTASAGISLLINYALDSRNPLGVTPA
jgi:hypothetical protein